MALCTVLRMFYVIIRKTLIVLSLALTSVSLVAQTYNRIGNTTYGSNGTTYQQIGNTTYSSSGKTYQSVGDTTYSSTGKTYQQTGSTTYGSDGTTAQQIGNTTYINGPRGYNKTCQHVGAAVYCN